MIGQDWAFFLAYEFEAKFEASFPKRLKVRELRKILSSWLAFFKSDYTTAEYICSKPPRKNSANKSWLSVFESHDTTAKKIPEGTYQKGKPKLNKLEL